MHPEGTLPLRSAVSKLPRVVWSSASLLWPRSRLAGQGPRSKYGTESSSSNAGCLEQALSPCFVFTSFAKDRTKDASPVVSLPSPCVRSVDPSVV